MNAQDIAYIIDQMDSRINLLIDKVQNKYSLEKYVGSDVIIDYFDIDKPNFNRLVHKGMPVIKIGGRWKGKLKDIEEWFANQNTVKIK